MLEVEHPKLEQVVWGSRPELAARRRPAVSAARTQSRCSAASCSAIVDGSIGRSPAPVRASCRERIPSSTTPAGRRASATTRTASTWVLRVSVRPTPIASILSTTACAAGLDARATPTVRRISCACVAAWSDSDPRSPPVCASTSTVAPMPSAATVCYAFPILNTNRSRSLARHPMTTATVETSAVHQRPAGRGSATVTRDNVVGRDTRSGAGPRDPRD